MDNNAFIMTENALTVYVNGKVHTIGTTDPRHGQAVELLRAEAWADIEDLLKPAIKIAKVFATAGNGAVELRDDTVYYLGRPLHNYVTERAVAFVSQGLNVQPLLNFIERVMQNPSSRAVNETFGFMEVGELPLTSDGCFLAYKKVRSDFMDTFSGTIRNEIGDVVTMPRNQVDDDPTRTCSHGLHFASRDYIKGYGGSHLMVLKIDPADVVAIPIDYENTKGRCCRYEVVGELEMTPEEKNAWGQDVVTEYDDEEEDFDDGDYEPEYDDEEEERPVRVPFFF
jgi:hypothetical protein